MIDYLRYTDYYGLTNVQQELYKASKDGKKFRNLYKIISSRENILLAYRSLKGNKGSNTPGIDGKTFEHYKHLSDDEFVQIIMDRMENFKPNAVKRVEIPKPGNTGKTRPLGIPVVEERIIQQAILQILEPICEAKFYAHSYGFRKNRKTIDAKARIEHLINTGRLYYCIDIDIKGFFDNVNYSKLMKQIYSLGIVDKKVLAIISKMLKAPVQVKGKNSNSDKGVPQGGVLSPLLSNIVLNELDHWVANNWEYFQTKFTYKREGDKKSALKKTKLKEMYIVRYADDFKVLCRNYGDAKKTYIAIQKWLEDRLKLELSAEKSKITNLKTNSTEFLGFSIRATKNKKKSRIPYTAHSGISKKARTRITEELKRSFKDMEKNVSLKKLQYINSKILGWHNYYSYASRCSLDFKWIFFKNYKWYYNKIPKILKELEKGDIDNNVFMNRYYHSSRKVYGLETYPIFPVDIISCKINKCHSQLEVFTKEGREKLIKDLDKEVEYIAQRMANSPIETRSVEYNDNRISRYTMQNGKCAITGIQLQYADIHCHHKILWSKSKNDSFTNLVILHKDIHTLIHMVDKDVISKSLTKFKVKGKKLERFWEFWNMVHCN